MDRVAALVIAVALALSTIASMSLRGLPGQGGVDACVGLGVVSVAWRSSTGGDRVYPGSRQASLMVELYNGLNATLENVYGIVTLPEGFTPSAGSGYTASPQLPNGSYAYRITPGTVFRFEYRLDVSEEVEPGDYVVGLNVTYVALLDYNGTTVREPGFTLLNLTVTISPYPPLKLEVVDVYWDAEHVYPGTQGATLNVMVYNRGEASLTDVHAYLHLPEGFEPSTMRLDVEVIGSGSTYTMRFTGIDVSPELAPGNYTALLVVNATSETEDGVAYESTWEANLTLTVTAPPRPRVVVVDAGWRNRVVYGESRLGDLYVTMQNRDMDTIEEVVATLRLPSGVSRVGGGSEVVASYEEPVGYGDLFTLVFKDLNVTAPNGYNLTGVLELEVLASDRGAEYWSTLAFNVSWSTSVSEDYLRLVGAQWSYQGSPATPLPSSRGVVLEVRVLNVGPETIETLVPEVVAPSGFTVRGVSPGSYTGVQPGGVASIDVTVDVGDDVEPGGYTMTLYFTVVVSSGDSVSYLEQVIPVTVYVGDPAQYAPRLRAVSYYWGSRDPAPAYPGQREAKLTVHVYNYGRYAASDLLVGLHPLNETVREVVAVASVGDLPPGGEAALVYTYDLEEASSGTILFNLTTSYAVKAYGAFVRFEESATLAVRLEEYAGYRGYGVEVVGYGWAQPPVFPCTENATFTVTIANRLPFQVGGVRARLELPQGFTVPSGHVAEAYVPGPLQSMQEASLSFTVSVGDVRPGVYRGSVEVEYVVFSGGTCSYRRDVVPVELVVHDIKGSVVFVTAYWLYQSPDAYTRGAYLVLVLQDIYVPSMNGVKAVLRLPEGLVYSYTNTSVAVVPPSYVGQRALAVTPGELTPSQVRKLVSLLAQGRAGEARASRGDYIAFTVPVSTAGAAPGAYEVGLELEFVDHLNNHRSLTIAFPIYVLGGTLYVDVGLQGKITLSRFNDTLELTLVNTGSGTMYNVYVLVRPYTPIVVPGRVMYYVGDVPPRSNVTIAIPIYFNPLYTAAYPSPVRYGTVPLMLSIAYRDPMGYQHLFNTSVTVVIEPFVELSLREVKARQVGSTIKASGIIANMGSATAERVSVKLVAGGLGSSTIVGDIDPSSEASFSVELEGVVGIVESCTLVVGYYDAYDHYHEEHVSLAVEQVQVTPTATPATGVLPSSYLIVGAVAVFLAVTLALIYRLVRQYEARLKG